MKRCNVTNSSQEQQSRTAVKNSSQEQQSRTTVKNYVLLIMAFMMMPFVSNCLYAVSCCSNTMESLEIEKTDDCCANLTITNECSSLDTTNVIQYEVFNDVTQSYEIVSTGSYGYYQTITTKICAINGENTIKYRVRLFEQDGITPKNCIGNTAFVDGLNQKSGEVTVTCCPCPPNVADYFTIDVIQGACPNNGCKVIPKLNLPDSLSNCFKYFSVKTNKLDIINGPYELWDGRINNTMAGFEDCIGVGEYYNATIYLLRSIDEPLESACKIQKRGVFCFNIPQEEKVLCKPDCFDDEWEPIHHDYFQTTNCPDCIAKVSYTWRHACNKKYQDLQISKIEFLNEACSKCDIDMLYRDFLGSIVALDRMGFDPELGDVGCNTTWRIANGGCWANWSYYVYDNGLIVDTVTVYEPCDSVDCCLQPMKVCRDAKGSVTISIDSANGSSANCTGTWTKSPTTGETLPCNPACDWLAGLNGEFPYQEPNGKIMKKEQYEEINYSNAYGIRTEVNEQEIKVNIKTEKAGEAKVAIFDMQGREIIAKNASINVGISQLNISTSGLSNGIYMYAIEIDGIRIKTDKISIVR